MGGRAIPREVLIERARAFLLDLDGTLLDEAGAIPGAVAAVSALRRRGVPFRILTNTSRHSRRRVLGRSLRRIAPFVSEDALHDLAEFTFVGGVAGAPACARPEAVVVGDLGDRWTHAVLNEALRYLLEGARLVALQRGRHWRGPTGVEVDAGAYVAALEYAADTDSVVCGKPNAEFFRGALASLDNAAGGGEDAPPVVMIGDDVWNDVDGAQRAGLEGWLVRTGKFRADVLERSGVRPDRVIDSVAELASGK